MIQFTPMTLKQALDRVMLLVSQHRTSVNLDEGTVIMFINRSIREAMLRTLAYKDFAYIATFPVTNSTSTAGVPDTVANMRAAGMVLPTNYLRYKRVVVQDPDEESTVFMEARYVDPKEFYTLSDWYKRQVHNRATVQNPIFTIWGQQGTAVFPAAGSVPVQSVPTIYIAPYTNDLFNDQTGTMPTQLSSAGYSYYTGTPLEGWMDAYLAPEDLTQYTDILPIPYEFEELVITLTILRVLAKMEVTNLAFYKQKSSDELMRAKKRWLEFKQTDRINLESFVDTVPGLAASGQINYVQPQPGEQ